MLSAASKPEVISLEDVYPNEVSPEATPTSNPTVAEKLISVEDVVLDDDVEDYSIPVVIAKEMSPLADYT